MATHIITYNRHSDTEGTGCGLPPETVKDFTLTERTGDARRVTCRGCKAYIRRTGDGPESLKALLRF